MFICGSNSQYGNLLGKLPFVPTQIIEPLTKPKKLTVRLRFRLMFTDYFIM